MADYKIANIKWLREKGWEISSSYADSICPTYNEIVNEIPKNSITVDVNGTCIATSKAYANNQLVCESDITIEPKGETCTCSQINVSITELNISADSALNKVGDITTNDCAPNVTYESTQPTWLSGVTTGTNNIRIKCSKNTAYSSRSGSVNVKMNGTTCSTVNVTQKGKPAPQYSVSTNLTISSGSSGSLRVTGSTYTAEFVIAGPNAGTGTLTGTLTADARDKMTFSGRWDGSPGANIYNSCTIHAPQGIYAIGDAHWDISIQKLYVNLIKCTP